MQDRADCHADDIRQKFRGYLKLVEFGADQNESHDNWKNCHQQRECWIDQKTILDLMHDGFTFPKKPKWVGTIASLAKVFEDKQASDENKGCFTPAQTAVQHKCSFSVLPWLQTKSFLWGEFLGKCLRCFGAMLEPQDHQENKSCPSSIPAFVGTFVAIFSLIVLLLRRIQINVYIYTLQICLYTYLQVSHSLEN